VNRMDALKDVRRTVHERLIGRVDARQLDAMPRAERRLRVREEALSLLREQGHMLPQSALADVVNAVSDAVVGMGPIEFLLKDPEVTEVMVNGPDDVYVERKGRIERVADRLFEGEEAVLHVIERIVAPLGLRVDSTSPWVTRDFRTALGCRPDFFAPFSAWGVLVVGDLLQDPVDAPVVGHTLQLVLAGVLEGEPRSSR